MLALPRVLVLLSCLLLAVAPLQNARALNLTFTGLFPLTKQQSIDGHHSAAGAFLALTILNRNVRFEDANISGALEDGAAWPFFLPDRRFGAALYVNDTASNPSTTTLAAYNQLQGTWRSSVPVSSDVPVAQIGAWSSSTTLPAALLSSVFNVPLMGFFATSPELSDTSLFRRYCRVVGPDTAQGQAIVKLIAGFGWKRLGIINVLDSYGRGFADTVQSAAAAADITVSFREEFFTGIGVLSPTECPQCTTATLQAMLQRIKAFSVVQEIDGAVVPATHPIVLIGVGTDVQHIMKEAHKLGMAGPKATNRFVWVGTDGWLDPRIVTAQPAFGISVNDSAIIAEAMYGVIGTRPALSTGKLFSWFDATWKQYEPQFEMLFSQPPGYFTSRAVSAPFAFDAMWALFHAIHNLTQGVAPNALTKATVGGDELYKALLHTSFVGVTGRIQFQDTCDRFAVYDIINAQPTGPCSGIPDFHVMGTASESTSTDTSSSSRSVLSGTQATEINMAITDNNFVWPDCTATQPRTVTVTAVRTSSVGVRVFAYLLAALCVVFSLFIFVFHRKYRKNPVIKMSSANINDLVIVGTVLAAVYVMLQAYASGVETASEFQNLCAPRLWTLTVSFTLVFSPLYAKTYRVHRIFNDPLTYHSKIHDKYLFAMVFTILGVEMLMLALYTAIDPPLAHLIDTKTSGNGSNQLLQISTLDCTSEHANTWLAVLVLYNMILIVFGAWLAWQTRLVTIKSLNDSKWIALCIFNIGVVVIFLGPVIVVSSVSINTQTALIATAVCEIILVVLVLLFLPKILAVIWGKEALYITQSKSKRKKIQLNKLQQEKNTYRSQVAELRRKLRKLSPQAETEFSVKWRGKLPSIDFEAFVSETRTPNGSTAQSGSVEETDTFSASKPEDEPLAGPVASASSPHSSSGVRSLADPKATDQAEVEMLPLPKSSSTPTNMTTAPTPPPQERQDQ